MSLLSGKDQRKCLGWKESTMPTEKSTDESEHSPDDATSGSPDHNPQLELPEDFMKATREAIVKIMTDDDILLYPKKPPKK